MNQLLSKTFLWMFVGLIVTFLTGYIVSINENMLLSIFGGPLFWLIIILEFALVIYFSARVHKMKPITAKICFLLYSFVSGLTFSSVFVGFEISSVMYVFLIAAVVFAIFGAIGYFVNVDLNKISTFLIMGLLAIIICSFVNLFLANTTFDLIVSIIALIIFFGFTAYDIQKVKILSNAGMNNDVVAINGAFELYLDFINIFLHLLSIIGNSRD
ncbi:MAG TPA: Bax inhibitor-1/YccA family protein [Candidatus Caccenecus avistercoris]|nr:Bax inhibitor-1/YccA family protein [Candidatus Caccenecus avistercoris]